MPAFSPLENASVLIASALGMIGSWLALTLLEASRRHNLNLTVHDMARNMTAAEPLCAGLRLVPISRDIAGALSPQPHFDYIIHAARPAGPSLFETSPFDVAAANLAWTANLLAKATREQSARFLFASTHEVYNKGTDVWLKDNTGELDFLSSRSCYPGSKRATENACVCAWRQHWLHTNIVYLAHGYSPGMNLDSRQRGFGKLTRHPIHHHRARCRCSLPAIMLYHQPDLSFRIPGAPEKRRHVYFRPVS